MYCCSALQCVAVYCSVLPLRATVWLAVQNDQLIVYFVLRCGALCSNVLHWVAVCCSVLQNGLHENDVKQIGLFCENIGFFFEDIRALL